MSCKTYYKNCYLILLKCMIDCFPLIAKCSNLGNKSSNLEIIQGNNSSKIEIIQGNNLTELEIIQGNNSFEVIFL